MACGFTVPYQVVVGRALGYDDENLGVSKSPVSFLVKITPWLLNLLHTHMLAKLGLNKSKSKNEIIII